MKIKTKAVCEYCHGENVRMDAYAEWDKDSQQWELAETFQQEFCMDCDAETNIKMVQINSDNPTYNKLL